MNDCGSTIYFEVCVCTHMLGVGVGWLCQDFLVSSTAYAVVLEHCISSRGVESLLFMRGVIYDELRKTYTK